MSDLPAAADAAFARVREAQYLAEAEARMAAYRAKEVEWQAGEAERQAQWLAQLRAANEAERRIEQELRTAVQHCSPEAQQRLKEMLSHECGYPDD